MQGARPLLSHCPHADSLRRARPCSSTVLLQLCIVVVSVVSHWFGGSGDEGANCKSDKFVAETPGSSPWVTAVGGTQGTKEQAIGLSSGGFSDRWAMPDYQTAAVHKYMAGTGLPAASRGYNVSGRAYPDISAQASGFTVVSNRIPEVLHCIALPVLLLFPSSWFCV